MKIFCNMNRFNMFITNLMVNPITNCGWRSLFSCLPLLILSSMWLMNPGTAFARTGFVMGSDNDSIKGHSMPDVFLVAQIAGNESVSNVNESYYSRLAPSGNQTFFINRLSYRSQKKSVFETAGELPDQLFQFRRDDQTDEDAGFGSGILMSQARNSSRQRTSPGFKSVVSSEESDRFADYTIEDALARVPGIQAGRRRVISIRGTGRDRYNVTVDGMRVVTTDMQHRSFELGGISTDMVRNIEVIKVITPDMDADAMAGTINLVTLRPTGDHHNLDIRLGGGMITRYDNSPGVRGSLNYSTALREDLSLSVNLSRFSDYRGLETLEVVYDVADFGSGPEDVIERISPGLQTHQRRMQGSTFQLNYQPSEQTGFYFKGMLNGYNQELVNHKNSRSANGVWLNQGITGEQGEYRYDMNVRDVDMQQYFFQTGAQHDFDLFDLEYNAGWVLNNRNQTDLLFPFRVDRVEYAINMDNRNRPTMQINNPTNPTGGTITSEQLQLQNLERVIDDRRERIYSGRVSLGIPIGFASIRMGSSALLTSQNRVFKDMNFRYRPLSLGTFSLEKGNGIHIIDQEQYDMPRLIDVSDARVFFANSYPSFRLNNDMFRERSETENYVASEHIYAGYAMATVELGNFKLIGGSRVEHENSRFDGRRVRFGQAGLFSEAVDTSLTISDTRLFPHAQLLFSPGSATDIRLAYSKTISRPGFQQRAPFELSNLLNLTLYRGNPDLQPMTSNNLDFLVEHQLANVGVVSVGLFHKQLSNFIFITEQLIEISEGDVKSFDGIFRDNEDISTLSVHERTFQNGNETAAISGIEISWQQDFDFLPGFLGNFGIYSNYTFSHSVFEVDYRDDEVSLPGQSPHVVNAALDYRQGRFSSRISYHWTAEALSELHATTIQAPSLQSESLYADRFEDGWTDMSLSLHFRIMDNFRLWANVTNLMGGNERLQYIQSREYYPVGIDYRGGRYFQAGLIFNL